MTLSYTAIPIARGRPPLRSSITACSNGKRAIRFALAYDLAQYIGAVVPGRLKIELGEGVHNGTLRLSVAAAGDQNCVTISGRGRRVSFNVRCDFLPDAVMPAQTVTLPHQLLSDAIIVDLAPLRNSNHD